MPKYSNKGSVWKVTGGKNVKHAYDIYAGDVVDPLTRSEYRKVLHACNRQLKEILLSGRNFKVPFLNSTICIYKKPCRQGGNYIDFKHFNETGEKKIKLFGGISGFIPDIRFERYKCRIANNRAYTFKASRNVIRRANALISGEDHIYFAEKLRYIPNGTK